MKPVSHIKPYPGTQAVIRAVTLLKLFSDARPEWGLTALAEAADLNKSTTYRLLTALESEGLVTRQRDTDAYRLGPEMITLGGRALRAHPLRAVAHRELEFLAQTTGETASLEVLRGDEVVLLDEVLGDYVMGMLPSIGTRWPAHATSTGKVLLASLPQDKLEVILKRAPAQLTKQTITDAAVLRQELSQVHAHGFAVAVDELEVGFTAVATPVYDVNGQVTAAISVGGPGIRLTPDSIPQTTRLLQEAAGRISAGLGYYPSD